LDWVKPATGKRLVVLGADGFIGSAVVRLALDLGASVTALCIRDSWRLENVAAAALEVIPNRRWWEPASRDTLNRALSSADGLALLAYEPPPETGDSVLDHELGVNARGARFVADIAGEHGVPTVFASSAEVYGSWLDDRVSEDAAPCPSRPYGAAKLEAERLVGEACDRHGVPTTSLRISTVFGCGENRPRAIPAFINAHLRRARPIVHGDGTDVRDYVFVEDVAGAVVNACWPDTPRKRVVNIGSGVGRSTIDVLRSVNAVMGAGMPALHEPSPRPASRLVVDPTLARRQLAFRPRLDFQTALAEEAAWIADRQHVKELA
jgi:UDP-glucose 4-epimerase